MVHGSGSLDLDADDAFSVAFDVVIGEVTAEVTENTAGSTELSLAIVKSPVLITYGRAVESVEFRAVMDLSEFDGSVRMVHHLQDSLSYHFVELENGTMRLGISSSGVEEIQDAVGLPDPEAHNNRRLWGIRRTSGDMLAILSLRMVMVMLQRLVWPGSC